MNDLVKQLGYTYQIEDSLGVPGMTYIHLYASVLLKHTRWYSKHVIWQIRL